MAIKYHPADDIKQQLTDIVQKTGMDHIKLDRVICVRSTGSKARYTIARCHTLTRLWQKALGIKSHYTIEIISEQFEKLPSEEQTKVLIHELMHIPFGFKGGFKHHSDHVNKKNIEKVYKQYIDAISPNKNTGLLNILKSSLIKEV
jgi:predicted metallopeptidase